MERLLYRKGLVFALLFIALSVIGMRVNFSQLVGAQNQFFTLFQFWGPIAGGFLGSGLGAFTVLIAQLLDFVLNGKAVNLLNLARLLPMLFGAYYFSKNKSALKGNLPVVAVSLIAMLIFWSTPAGAGAWYFALFWLIPVVVIVLNETVENNEFVKSAFGSLGSMISRVPFLGKILPNYPQLFLLSLGATFTAHAVGGAIWALAVPMTAAAWIALIPVVIYERVLFALGISISYIVFANVLTAIDKVANIDMKRFVRVDERLLL